MEVIVASMSDRPALDAQLFEEIYRQYYKNIYNYISYRINNHFDTEELASAVFEKAISKWRGYNPAYPIEAWLIGIAKNTVTDYLRVQKRRQFAGLDGIFHLVSSAKRPDEVAVFNEENRALMAAMTRLKDIERQILSLKFATELKHSEIAQIMNIGESNVGVIVHRALKKLRKILEEVPR